MNAGLLRASNGNALLSQWGGAAGSAGHHGNTGTPPMTPPLKTAISRETGHAPFGCMAATRDKIADMTWFTDLAAVLMEK